MSVLGTVYLVHLDEPFGHARHYCGWAADLAGRMAHHRAGTGANLLRHVRAAGIGWRVVRTWSGDRHLERRIKVRGGLARACPLCLGRDPVVDHPLALCCPRCQVEAGTACRTRSGRSTSPHAARRALVAL